MKLERILTALDENRSYATAGAVAELTGTPARELASELLGDPQRAKWVIPENDTRVGAPCGPAYVAAGIDVPVVIRDATRLRMLVLATELTARIP